MCAIAGLFGNNRAVSLRPRGAATRPVLRLRCGPFYDEDDFWNRIVEIGLEVIASLLSLPPLQPLPPLLSLHTAPLTMRKSTAPRLLKLQLGGLLMVFFSASVLLMASLKDKATGRYPFEPSSVVISVEALKFVVTLCVVAKQGQLGLLRGVFTLSSFRYAVPALLYMTNNTLDFAVLLYIQAPLASLLNNAKIVLTGIVFRFALGRRLNMIQWISIALLTLGMAIAKEEPGGAHSSIGPGPKGGHVAARASSGGGMAGSMAGSMGGSMGGSGSGLGGGGRGGEGAWGGSGDGVGFIGSLNGHMFGVGLKVRGSGR